MLLKLEESSKDSLCEICRKIDFQGQFSGRPRLDLYWDVALVKTSSQYCAFCKLLLSSVYAGTGYHIANLDDKWKIWGHWVGLGKYRPTWLKTTWPQMVLSIKTFFVNISGFGNGDQPRSVQAHEKSTEIHKAYDFSVGLDTSATNPNGELSEIMRDSGQCILLHTTGLEAREVDRILKCRPIDPGQVDFRVIRDWLRRCERGHYRCLHSTIPRAYQQRSSFGSSMCDGDAWLILG
jgi:hypothetical protein